ncbi:EbsA family protein [Leuconostoc mesenteroides]|uniref:EbsA family protein n=1 Tax=Leuconostoc mesenteroides TaxID=1245 RepID=UPI00388AF11E
MIPRRGFFQPLDSTGTISWLWWGIFFMGSIVVWDEMSFKLEILPILFIMVMILLGVLLVVRRRVYIAGPNLFLGRVLLSEYEKISLKDIEHWQLNGHVLSFVRTDRERKYYLTKNIVQQIKDYMDTDGK